MSRRVMISLSIVALAASIGLSAAGAGAAPRGQNFGTHLIGGEEVPPRATLAQGQATFQLNDSGDELAYRLIVSNIENVTASHIHLAPAGTNGGVVAFLAGPFPAGGGRSDGVLATGTITSADLIGSLAGEPLSELIEEMRAGNAYVNVHTDDGVPPPNTGPGDFPGGEIRGQIEARGPQG